MCCSGFEKVRGKEGAKLGALFSVPSCFLTLLPSYLLTLVLLAFAPGAAAQPADTTRRPVVVAAPFEEARALAPAPGGTLYVVDAGREVLVRLSPEAPEGTRLAELGGPGSRAGAFDQPMDVDPTNGLVLYVADAGNGRIQRFSRAFRHLGTLSLNTATDFAEGTGASRIAWPTHVEAAPSGAVFVLDGAGPAVWQWQPAQQAWQRVGGFDEPVGALRNPVALAYSSGRQRLFVADRAQAAVLVYDAFGTYAGTLLRQRVPGVRALTWAEDRLWVLLANRILICTPEGVVQEVMPLALPEGEAPVDVQPAGDALYVLSETTLYRFVR